VGPTGLDDKTILADSLLAEKNLAKYYADSILESSNPDVRRNLIQLQSEELDAAHRIWQQMNEKGYYSVRRAEPNVISRIQSTFGGQQARMGHEYGPQYGQQQYGPQQYGQQQYGRPYAQQNYGQHAPEQYPPGAQQAQFGQQNVGGMQGTRGYGGGVGSRLLTPTNVGGQGGYGTQGDPWAPQSGRDIGYVGYGPGEGRTTGIGYGPGEEVSRTGNVGFTGAGPTTYGPGPGQGGYTPGGYGGGTGRGYQGSVSSRLLTPAGVTPQGGYTAGGQGGYGTQGGPWATQGGRDIGYVGYGPGEGRTTGIGYGPGEEVSRGANVRGFSGGTGTGGYAGGARF